MEPHEVTVTPVIGEENIGLDVAVYKISIKYDGPTKGTKKEIMGCKY